MTAIPISALDHVTPQLLALRLKSGIYRWNQDAELEKRCADCREYWPADDEFFFTGRGYPDRLHCYCKACYLERRWPERFDLISPRRPDVQGTAPVRANLAAHHAALG